MLASTRSRVPAITSRLCQTSLRPLSTSTRLQRQGPGTGENFEQANDPTPRKLTPNVSQTNETAVSASGAQDATLRESATDAEQRRQMQAPNRAGIWSRNQMPRERAMSGPRFEQTIMELQPRPYAAIELIHKQPVRWVDKHIVACDGGGGPLGHPKIFINTAKPQVCLCNYCGLPYANEGNRKFLESQPSTPYPLAPTGDPAEVRMPESPSQFGHIQGQHPELAGEHKAESMDGQPYHQR